MADVGQVELPCMKKKIFLIFYTNEEHHGNTMMAEVAETRMKNIKKSKWYKEECHKVHCPPIQTMDEIIKIVQRYIKIYGGETKAFIQEVGIVSHSANDGPINYVKRNTICPLPTSGEHKGKQMDICGWEKIEFNWSDDNPMIVFYGCNSGRNKPSGFAKRISKLSNFKNVTTWGQSTSSFPSFYPDYRVTSVARSMGFGWDIRDETYLVGGNLHEGRQSIGTEGKHKEVLSDFPKANPMNAFKNGSLSKSSHQGVFNDHRK